MGSIDDFVNQRWSDAKATLRQLDKDYVDKIESEVRLQALRLTTPWLSDVRRRPVQELSSEWHRLMEECLEATMQVSTLQLSADSLTADANNGLSHTEAGRRVHYHFRSWFIHAKALAESVNAIIKLTTEVYIADQRVRTELVKRLRGRVCREVSEWVGKQRNSYVHATPESWASGITEDRIWEFSIAVGMIPQKFLHDFHYPDCGDKVRGGEYSFFIDRTNWILDTLGSILQELEVNIPRNSEH